MKRFILLIMALLLMLTLLTACGEKEYEFDYDEFTSIQHSIGNLKNADVGIYPVKYITRNESGEIKAIIPGTVSIKIVKDEIVNVIEINNGNFLNRNGNLSDEIVQIIEETSYRTVGNCDEGYQGYQRNGAPNDGNRAAVCLKCVPVTSGIDDYYVELLGNNVVGTNDFPNGYYIQVVVFYQLDIPVVNQVYDFKTKGETRILFGDEGGLCS